MTDRWANAVRHQMGLGRLLPLGGARDGAWIAEDAAEAVLRHAVRQLGDVRLDAVRIALADPEDVHEPVVTPPPGAVPPGPLRVSADFAATAAEPLPMTATRLRAALATAAKERLGLKVAEVDLRVTELLDEEPGDDVVRPSEPPTAEPAGDPAADAALSVPGVVRLTGLLGQAVVQVEAALPRRHVRVEVTVDADRRALDVAREVRAQVKQAVPGHPTVAVLVTAVE